METNFFAQNLFVGIPVLFIHGHAGSYKQVFSIYMLHPSRWSFVRFGLSELKLRATLEGYCYMKILRVLILNELIFLCSATRGCGDELLCCGFQWGIFCTGWVFVENKKKKKTLDIAILFFHLLRLLIWEIFLNFLFIMLLFFKPILLFF